MFVKGVVCSQCCRGRTERPGLIMFCSDPALGTQCMLALKSDPGQLQATRPRYSSMDYATFPWKCSADPLTNISILLPSPELGFRAAGVVPVLSSSDASAGRAGEQRALGEPDSTWAFSFFSSLPRKIKIYSPLQLLEKEGGKVQKYFKYLLFFLRGKMQCGFILAMQIFM